VVSSNTTTYAWDYENRLTSVTLPSSGGTVTFKYDPLGRRIYKSLSTGGTSVFAYDGDNLIEETNSSGTVVARYEQTQNIDEPLAMLRSSTTSYYNADGLGSVTSLANASGTLTQSYTYDSFGKTTPTGSVVNPFQYTGRELDSETGLYYYRARYYDPGVGRFIGEDPIQSGLNFYAYTHNSPTGVVDPFGLQDSASPWQVGWEWLSGRGPRTHHFTDGDPFTELLRHHQHVQDLIKDICDGALPPQGNFNYSLSGAQGVPKYLQDYSTLFTGGLTGNLAATYLGSYGLSYTVTNGTLNVHVWNDSTIASATHPPVIGYTNWWNQHIGDPLDKLISSGPMSKTSQYFDFHENLNDDCGCKK
jgi:RHS repeat-associated protein